MTDHSKFLEEIKTHRDELKLKIHLGTKEVQEEYGKLEAQWNQFAAKAKLGESAEGLGEALGSVGEELKKSYKRLKKAL